MSPLSFSTATNVLKVVEDLADAGIPGLLAQGLQLFHNVKASFGEHDQKVLDDQLAAVIQGREDSFAKADEALRNAGAQG